MTTFDVCHTCDGEGWIEAGQWPCPVYAGTGMVATRLGDDEEFDPEEDPS